MKPYIQISLRTKIETTEWSVGKKLLESLSFDSSLLAPEYISHNADKVTELFEGDSHAEKMWAEKICIRANGSLSELFDNFAWKRQKSVKSKGSISHTMRNLRNQIVPGGVHLNSKFSDKVNWFRLFKSWCEIFSPQLGMLHYFTEPELGPHEVNESFQIGSFNAMLKPDVPNAGWAMFYGNEFAEKVDMERIFHGGFPIERMGDGYLVRVTENIQDVARDFELFAQRRLELKGLFPDGFFLIQ
ncbi:hypothetical protein [Achromobacter aegrifaciens]|uniref:YubB ferredoxin-like domain-containing protein n=1 Tax=Achromobacter aegrifaciens TaxID=1287736 RepID=A0ABU2DA74_ACHAE|nr:hypothetical protein [Achromobacter aegrifaciens]MDR7945010.1 hypothetical protein [Achromobacter aegrifaciens]